MAMLLTTRPEPLRSSRCNIQMALTRFWERRELGRVWEPLPPPLLSAPVQSRPPHPLFFFFPSLDGVWMTGTELPAGVPLRGRAGPRHPRPTPRSLRPAPRCPSPAPPLARRAAPGPRCRRRRLRPQRSPRHRCIGGGKRGRNSSSSTRGSEGSDKYEELSVIFQLRFRKHSVSSPQSSHRDTRRYSSF